MSWTLQEEFIFSEMNRLDHPYYFNEDFRCDDLDTFFLESLTDAKKIWKKRNLLNHFFDRIFNPQAFCTQKQNEKACEKRMLYIKMKWIIYLHHLIQKTYANKELLYHFTHKGLHIFIKEISQKEDAFGPYENYLLTYVFKPYLKYLLKICQLDGHVLKKEIKVNRNKRDENLVGQVSQQDKENSNIFANIRDRSLNRIYDEDTSETSSFFHAKSPTKSKNNKFHNNVFICDTKSNSNSSVGQSPKKQIPQEISIKWYRQYNLLMEAVQTLQKPLKDVKDFFEIEFPFLNNMAKLLSKDFKRKINDLKKTYEIYGDSLIVTPLQMDQLNLKIGKFSIQSAQDVENYSEIVISEIHELRKQKIAGFMASGEKEKKRITWGNDFQRHNQQQCMSISTFLID